MDTALLSSQGPDRWTEFTEFCEENSQANHFLFASLTHTSEYIGSNYVNSFFLDPNVVESREPAAHNSAQVAHARVLEQAWQTVLA